MNYQELAINLAIVGHYRRQQDKAPAGWQKSIATDGQAHSAVQLFTSLRLLNPEFTENEAMRRAVQFETEAFITSQTKDHYMERLKTQLSQMQDLRQSQLPDTSPRDKSNATARNPFKRRSEEGIDMKFSPSDWDAKFEGKPDYFAPTMPKGTSGTHNTLASSMDLVKINHMANMGQQSNPQQQFAQTVLSPTPFDPQLAPRLVREAQQRVAATQQQRFFAAEHSQQQMLKVSDQQFQGMLANFIRPQGEQRLHNLLALLQQSPGIITATDDKLFPPNVLNAQIEQSLRTDIKTWAQVKHWAGQNPALIPNIDGNKFVLLQVLHFQDQLIKQKRIDGPFRTQSQVQQSLGDVGNITVTPQEIDAFRAKLFLPQRAAPDEELRNSLLQHKVNARKHQMVQQLNQQQVLNLQAQRNQAARQPSDAAPQALPMAPLRSQQSIQNLTPDRIAKLTLTQQQQQKKAQQHLSTLIPTIPPFERSENSETFVAIVGMHPMYMDRDGAMSCSWAH